ncbi:MAG: thioredoxin family protein [Myxococcales bacterium]|nr:thioredoxin family protein [Myxococcales bacterium]
MSAATPDPKSAASPIIEVWTKDEFVENVLEAESPVVVDFWAAWCQPCVHLAPIFIALAEAHPEVRFVKVDADRARPIAEAVGIKSLPTIGFYFNGRLEDVFIGARSRPQLEKRIVALKDKAAGKGFFQRLLGR